jgi:hypothetical protein
MTVVMAVYKLFLHASYQLSPSLEAIIKQLTNLNTVSTASVTTNHHHLILLMLFHCLQDNCYVEMAREGTVISEDLNEFFLQFKMCQKS